MRKERYNLCKKLIDEVKWNINLDTGEVIGERGGKGFIGNKGYLRLRVRVNGKNTDFKVHEIVAIAGGLNPSGTTIDHINSNKLDNRLCNLQLLSRADNSSKANKGSKSRFAKLSDNDVKEIKLLLLDGKLSQGCIGWLYNVSQSTITRINKGNTWKDIQV